MSIRRKIILFFTVMVIIPILTLSFAFYIISSGILQEKVSASNLLTIRQTGSNIESLMSEVHRLSLDLIQNQDIRTYLSDTPDDNGFLQRNHLAAVNLIHRKISSNTSIHSIYIQAENGRILKMRQEKEAFSSARLNRMKEQKGQFSWYRGFVQNYDQSVSNSIYLSRAIYDVDNISRLLGFLRIDISEMEISEIYGNPSSLGETVLIDTGGIIVSSTKKDEVGLPADLPDSVMSLVKSSNRGYKITRDGNENQLFTYCSIRNTDWVLVNHLPLKELLKEMKMIRNVLIYSVLISFFIFTVASYLFINSALQPLGSLRDAMARFEKGQFDTSLVIRGHDEISLVSQSFNQMVERFKELMDQVYISTIKQKDAELKALQNQINPHFLYNTLDTIYWMSLMEKGDKTARLIQALGNLFRLSLNSGDRFTTVEREIQHLESYLIIQNERYDDTVEFNIQMDDHLKDCKVLKLILQPLVENSLYHGIEPKGEKGTITLKIFEEDDALVYSLKDDGIGADQEKINALINGTDAVEQSKGFALKNVNDRIKLHHGSRFGIEFHSIRGEGSTVIVRQSLDRGGEHC